MQDLQVSRSFWMLPVYSDAARTFLNQTHVQEIGIVWWQELLRFDLQATLPGVEWDESQFRVVLYRRTIQGSYPDVEVYKINRSRERTGVRCTTSRYHGGNLSYLKQTVEWSLDHLMGRTAETQPDFVECVE